MRLAWPGSSLGRAWGLAVEPLKGYLDLGLVVRGYALAQGRPGVCHGGRALGVLLLSFLRLWVGLLPLLPLLQAVLT